MELNKNQIELVNHIKAENAKMRAWVGESPETRCAGELVTDPLHWAEFNIFTVEDYEKAQLGMIISDASKSAYGYRKKVNWQEHTLDELKELADFYCQQANNEFERQEEDQSDYEAEELADLCILAESLNVSVEDLERWGVA